MTVHGKVLSFDFLFYNHSDWVSAMASLIHVGQSKMIGQGRGSQAVGRDLAVRQIIAGGEKKTVMAEFSLIVIVMTQSLMLCALNPRN